jgi:hypothetical protein
MLSRLHAITTKKPEWKRPNARGEAGTAVRLTDVRIRLHALPPNIPTVLPCVCRYLFIPRAATVCVVLCSYASHVSCFVLQCCAGISRH